METVKKDLLIQIEKIIQSLFPNSVFEMSEQLTAGDVRGWDSLSHVKFLVAIEETFGVTIRLQDVDRFHNIGELVLFIQRSQKGELF